MKIAASRNHNRRPRSECGRRIVIGQLGHHVADAAHVLDQLAAQLFAQAVDIDLDRVAAHFVAPAVELFFQLGAREHGAGPRDQRLPARPIRAPTGVTGTPAHVHFAGGRIDGDALVFEDRLGAAGRAAQQGADARQQFIEIVGFQDVIVGAGIEAGDALADGVARGGHQHRACGPCGRAWSAAHPGRPCAASPGRAAPGRNSATACRAVSAISPSLTQSTA